MITIAMNLTALLPTAPVVCGEPKRLWREPVVAPAAPRQSYALFTDHVRFGATKRNPLVPRPRAKLG